MPHYSEKKSGLSWITVFIILATAVVCVFVFINHMMNKGSNKPQEVLQVQTNAVVEESVSVVEMTQEPVVENTTEQALNEMGLSLSNSFKMSVK